jgi:hypothetical protein
VLKDRALRVIIMPERNALELPTPREISPLCQWVEVFHPVQNMELFRLPAYALISGPGAEPDQYVVEYQLVMDACRIVTNGEGSSVYLARKEGNERVSDGTATLAPGQYFYYMSEETATNYQVVTDFAAWKFPHGSFPLHWRGQRSEARKNQLDEQFDLVPASNMSALVKGADQQCCVITKYRHRRSS